MPEQGYSPGDIAENITRKDISDEISNPLVQRESSEGDKRQEKEHPWDVEHPWIERIEGGWKLKETGEHLPEFIHPTSPELLSHPVIYKLFAPRGGRITPESRWNRRLLQFRFRDKKVLTDEEVNQLPNPPRWPKPIRERWPELKKKI